MLGPIGSSVVVTACSSTETEGETADANGKTNGLLTIEVGGPKGIDTYKLFVTDKPQDFTNWSIDSVREAERATGGLGQLLTSAFHRTRQMTVVHFDPPDQWGVKTEQMEII